MLPFFVKYTFPKDFKSPEAKLCWKGQAYLKVDNYKGLNHLEKECIFINDFYDNKSNTFTIWLIETGKTKKLKVSFSSSKEIMIKNTIKEFSQFLSAILICLIVFINLKNLIFYFFLLSFLFFISQ